MYGINTEEELQAYYMEEAHERWLSREWNQGYDAAEKEYSKIIAELKAEIEQLKS